MVVMETLLKDLCSSCDTHAAHALIDRSTQLNVASLVVCVSFCHFHKMESTSSTLCYLRWRCDLFGVDGVRSALFCGRLLSSN